MTHEESIEHQLKEWLAGRPWHNTVSDECCPDFSCCAPQMLAPLATRKAFVEASPDDRLKFLGGFLSAGIGELTDAKIYVAGDAPPERAN